MQIVSQPVTRDELTSIAQANFGKLVKAVVDIKKSIMVIDAPLHADEESHLLSLGSDQKDLWGINLYPEMAGRDMVEFDSMINLRPSQNNNSRGVEDTTIQEQIYKIVEKLVV